MNPEYDSLVIGAGHNGLVTAALLAKAGHRVVVVEQRDVVGGLAATEALWPGYRVNTGSESAALFMPELVAELALDKHGLAFVDDASISSLGEGTPLTLTWDPEHDTQEIARISSPDAENYPGFIAELTSFAAILRQIAALTPPDISEVSLTASWPWLRQVMKPKQRDRRALLAFLRVAPMSLKSYLDEWFEDERLKGLLAGPALVGIMQGPYAPGTALLFIYHYMGITQGRFGPFRSVLGGVGALCTALAKAVEAQGGEILTGQKIDRISLAKGSVSGVVLADGREISAKRIISNADPYQTLIGLVGPRHLGPQFVRKIRNYRQRGATTKLVLALDELPKLTGIAAGSPPLSGHLIHSPSMGFLEQAYDRSKYGEWSTNPYLDIAFPTIQDPSLAPSGKHLMTVIMQYTPYAIRQGSWESQRQSLAERILTVVSRHAEDVMGLIAKQYLMTPIDWESNYGLTGGCIMHGEMALDQLVTMRPVPGFARFRTPIRNLYLCGAGTHPGGGVTGLPGYNAAREVLADARKSPV